MSLSELSDEELEEGFNAAWEEVYKLEKQARLLRDLAEEKYLAALKAREVAWKYLTECNRRRPGSKEVIDISRT